MGRLTGRKREKPGRKQKQRRETHRGNKQSKEEERILRVPAKPVPLFKVEAEKRHRRKGDEKKKAGSSKRLVSPSNGRRRARRVGALTEALEPPSPSLKGKYL